MRIIIPGYSVLSNGKLMVKELLTLYTPLELTNQEVLGYLQLVAVVVVEQAELAERFVHIAVLAVVVPAVSAETLQELLAVSPERSQKAAALVVQPAVADMQAVVQAVLVALAEQLVPVAVMVS